MSKALKIIRNFLFAFLLLLVLADIIMIARVLDIIRLPIEISDTVISKHSAYALLHSYEDFAYQAKVNETENVQDALSRFMTSIDCAETPKQVAEAIRLYAGVVQDMISDEQAQAWKTTLLDIINQDEGVKKSGDESALIVISSERNGFATILKIDDRSNLLTDHTKKELQSNELFQQLSLLVEIEITNGKAQILVPSTVMDQIHRLQSELEMLKANLASIRHAAGWTNLTGEGIIIEAYDAPGGYVSEEIVHDVDIRDMINELCYAGAQGIEVGNQRLVTGSPIRCVGPGIDVNKHPISVNPVVIKVIGPKDALASALMKIKDRFELFNRRLEIKKVDSLTIGAYQGGR